MIPNGTKFHGVAPSVPTENLGSASVNAKRDVYTFPDDFQLPSVVMANGTFVNFGAFGGGADILGGSSIDWGVEQTTASDHFPFLIVPFEAKIKGFGAQWGSNTPYSTASGSSTVTFNVFKAELGNLMTDAASWTQVGSFVTEWDQSSDSPGFFEDATTLNLDIPVGSVIQVTAIASSGFGNTGEEVEASIILQEIV
jgi:hypothetical protein